MEIKRAKVWDPETKKWMVKDEQTGFWFEIVEERWWDSLCALVSFVYLFAMLLILLWLLIRTWVSGFPFLDFFFGAQHVERFKSALFQLLAYAAIAGGLGGVTSGIRSVTYWHLQLKAFGARFLVRDLMRPVLGAFLAVVVYILVRIGFGIISGDILKTNNETTQRLWAFSIGVLAGYSSDKVFVWLDDLTKRVLRRRP